MNQDAAKQGLFLSGVRLEKGGPSLSLELPKGMNALVVPRAAWAATLIATANGSLERFRGKVSLDGVETSGDPALRAAIGSVLPEENFAQVGGSVRNFINTVSELRARFSLEETTDALPFEQAPSTDEKDSTETDSAETDSAETGVPDLSSVALSDLSQSQAQRLALALALRLAAPRALLLDRPFSSLSAEESAQVLDILSRCAAEGTVVVCLFRTSDEARLLSLSPLYVGPGTTKAQSENCRFFVRCERPREAARHLATNECVLSTRVDPKRGQMLVLECSDERAGAKALAEALSVTQADVYEITPVRGAFR